MGIKWSGPRKGPGSVEDKVSHMPQVKAALRKHADSMASHGETTLMVHRATGDAKVIAVHYPTTDLDSYVILQASGGKKAPLSIENGHWEKRGDDMVWIDGFHPLKHAVRQELRKKVVTR